MNEPAEGESLLDHPAVSGNVFHPRPGRRQPNFEVMAGDVRLGCFRREFARDRPWVVHFHGNGELAEECDEHLAGLFGKCGANVCFVEYRGYGSSGDRPRLGSMLADGARVFEALGIPAKRTIAFGRSIGSIFAIELASRVPGLGGLAIESGIANPYERLPIAAITEFGMTRLPELRDQYETWLNHQEKLANYDGPMLVLHTRNDGLVNVSNAERLHAWGGGSARARRLEIFERGHHNSILAVNSSAYARLLGEFVETVRENSR